jgi:hypothetical protein
MSDTNDSKYPPATWGWGGPPIPRYPFPNTT